MATGDQNDFLNRLLAVVPPWYGDPTTDPILMGLLTGYAELGSVIYQQYAYSKLQTRIKTATDIFNDLISADFFGVNLPRGLGEADPQFKQRILNNMFGPVPTRQGMYNVIYNLTGRVPRIIEPWRPLDCGAYSTACAGYGVAGAWGSTLVPYQAFIDVYRANVSTVPGVTGYTDPIGGYGVGYIAYCNVEQMNDQVIDAQILTTINATKVYGTVVWVRLNN